MDAPKGEGWRKCPSCTTGGRPFFWFRHYNGMSQWYVWDRQLEQWVGRIEYPTFHARCLALDPTV
jgi:hypothetical protein